MKYLSILMRLLGSIFTPIRKNAAFFLFMYVLGYTCNRISTPSFSELGAFELFVDLYLVCLILSLIPWRFRRWVRALLYVVFYATSLVDMYCVVKFKTTFSPTMLLLMSETTGREAAEFLQSYLGWNLIGSEIGWILLILLVHILYSIAIVCVRGRGYKPRINHQLLLRLRMVSLPLLGALTLLVIERGITERMDNKRALMRMMSYKNVGDVERELTRKDQVELYLPVYRFAFSLFANELAAKQIDRLTEATEKSVVDSCSFLTPTIVVVIGESYNRHHSQLYGYDRPTTPRQLRRAENSRMSVFTDVVSPYNLTSFVFKNIFSLNAVGDSGEWCDYPLFPEVFRKAGYRVTFVTNQFQTRANEAVYDFSGGFFLNHPDLSKAMFDVRNEKLHRYDSGVLQDYDRLLSSGRLSFDGKGDHNLIILHLMGQHVNYKDRTPRDRKPFTYEAYPSEGFNRGERRLMADYDNAVLYNDSIVDAIIQRFEDQEAVVVYFGDHGEECYGDGLHVFGRLHSAKIDYRLAHEEFEIPFWIWCSRPLARSHPSLVKEIRDAREKPFMTDRLPHLLLYLGGISSPYYQPAYNPLSPDYDSEKPRLLKNSIDYNLLKREHEAKLAAEQAAEQQPDQNPKTKRHGQ